MRHEEAFRILGLNAPSTPAEIKAAYRQRVKTTHPDRFGTDADLRVLAEVELRRIIESYRFLQQRGVEPEPEDSTDDAGGTGASTFSIHPMSASSRGDRRRDASFHESRRRSRYVAQRVALVLLPVAVIVVLWRSFESWRSLTSIEHLDVTPPIIKTVIQPLQPMAFVEGQATLSDRVACDSPNTGEYRHCLSSRLVERLSGTPTTTTPGNTPFFRKVLCSALQSDFSEDAYNTCVAESGYFTDIETDQGNP